MSSNVTILEDYYDGTDSEEDVQPKLKKRRSENRSWLKVEDFTSAKEAEAATVTKGIWKKCASYDTADGLKVRYRCTAEKYRSNECPASLSLLFHSTSETVTMFETEAVHANHSSDPTKGLSDEMKNFIKSKFDDGIRKPNALLTLIRKQNMVEPPKSKLVTSSISLSLWTRAHHWAVKNGKVPSKCRCTCPSFQKYGNCKHLLGMKIRLQMVTAPAAVKTIPIGLKRKRERPKTAGQALIVQ
jgi:hypothetical protein